MSNPWLNTQSTESQPLVSVVIPAYNAERFIARTLDSVLAQTYSQIEILVIDDGSQDGTAAMVREYMQKDARVQLLQQANAGVAAARNLGIEKSKGDFIAPLDADDIWKPENLEKQVSSFLKADERLGIVYSWSFYIDEDDLPLNDFCAAKIEGVFYAVFLCHNFIGNSSATLIKRSCLKEIGGYSENLKAQGAQGCEDFDLYLRIAENYQIKAVPEFLVGYRKLSGSMSSNFDAMAKSHEIVLRDSYRKYPEIPETIYRLSRSSLYLYFARQSYHLGDLKATLFWVSRSLSSAFLITLIRPEFYLLSLKCRLGLAISERENLHKTSDGKKIFPSEKNLSVQVKIAFCNLLGLVMAYFNPPVILF